MADVIINEENNIISVSEEAAEVNVTQVSIVEDVESLVITQTNSEIRVVGVGAIYGGASDKTYIHRQDENSDLWEVEHNLNKYPSVTVVDSGENVVYASVEYIDENNLRISFNGNNSGKAYIN